MSKEMKNFLSQFITQAEPIEVEALEKNLIEKSEAKPKSIKTTIPTTEKKVSTKATAKAIINTEGVGEPLSVEAFLLSINDKKFAFDKKKNLQIDDQLFTVLTLLKQHKNIKSITNLLNAIVEKYITDNKEELKIILSKNPLNNF